MQKAEDIITKKSDIFELFKLIDQFKIVKKLTFNENQYFMLKETEKQTIYTDLNKKTEKEIEYLKEAKHKLKKENLDKYLKRHKESNSLTSTDHLILKYCDKKVEDIDKKDKDLRHNSINDLNHQFE